MAIGAVSDFSSETVPTKNLQLVTIPPFCGDFAGKLQTIAEDVMSNLRANLPPNGKKNEEAQNIYNNKIEHCGDLMRGIHALNDIYRQHVANAILEEHGLALPTHPRGRFLEERHVSVSTDTLKIVYGELEDQLEKVLKENEVEGAYEVRKAFFPDDLLAKTEAAIKEHAALIKEQTKTPPQPMSFEERERTKKVLNSGLNTPPVI